MCKKPILWWNRRDKMMGKGERIMKYKVTRKGGEKVLGWICVFFFMLFSVVYLCLIIAGESFGIASDLLIMSFWLIFIGLGIFIIYRGSRPKVVVENNNITYYPPFDKPISISIMDICGRRISKSATDPTVAMVAGATVGGAIGALIMARISSAMGEKKTPLYISYKTRDGKIISIYSRMKNADLLDQSIVQHLKMIGEPENVADFSTPAEQCLDERFEDVIIEEKFHNQADAEHYIKKQYKTKVKTRIIQVIFFLLLAASIFMAFFYRPDEISKSIPFDRSKIGIEDCCYIDIIAISDWTLKTGEETYYLAVNSEGQYVIARLDDDSYAQLTAQREFFYETTNNVPEPCRLYGMGQILTSEYREELAEVLGVSEQEIWSLCGSMYFDDATPYDEQREVFVGISFAFGLFAIIVAWAIIHRRVNINRSIKRLRNSNSIIAVANEVYSVNGLWKDKNEFVVITKSFFFSAGGYIIPLSEILWCYVKTTKSGKKGNDSIIISTAKKKEIAVGTYPTHTGKAYDIQSDIAKRNPNTLIGYSAENKMKFNQIRNN